MNTSQVRPANSSTTSPPGSRSWFNENRELLHNALMWVAIVWIAIPAFFWMVAYNQPKDVLEKSGLIGDLFGTVNAAFAGLGVFGVVITLFMQQSQLRLQQEEIDRTKSSLAEQSELMRATALLTALPPLIEQAQRNLLKCRIKLSSKADIFDTETLERGIEALTEESKMREEEFESSGRKISVGLFSLEYEEGEYLQFQQDAEDALHAGCKLASLVYQLNSVHRDLTARK